MYKFTGFTEKANRALNSAVEVAENMGHTYIGTEHLLAGLVKDDNGVGTKMLLKSGVTLQRVEQQIKISVGVGIPTVLTPNDFTPKCKSVIEQSVKIAKSENMAVAGSEHLLFAISRQWQSSAGVILKNLGVSENEIAFKYSDMYTKGSFQTGKKAKNTNTPTLDTYSVDLTLKAKNGKIDNLIGRENEIQRVIQILSRRSKNNPCLVGEPGVGKTAIAEGLAMKICEGDVPEELKDKRVVSLDLTCVVAGTKYRGDFEERIKQCINETVKAQDVILFIDEVHNLVGTGSAEGAVDAANILKPFLARSDLQLIGATTFGEYKKYIEKDSALERRFAVIKVGEPTKEQALSILKGLREKYELHHKVKIDDGALESAVYLSVRYMFDRFLPDKALDILDEACAKVKLKSFTSPPEIKEIENELKKISEKKASAIKAQSFETAAKFRDEEKKKITELTKAKALWKEESLSQLLTVTKDDVAEVLSVYTGIPIGQLTTKENEKLIGLEETLAERIVGQKNAVELLSKALKRSGSGLKDENRPIGSFLFLGPTGVGKTELCKALAFALFSDERAIVRFDMSEFMASHSLARLVGSPPGYVGHEQGGELTEKIRQKPYSIVLFDEIEKAHGDIFNILLQILDEGTLTDSQGRHADFKNTVVIMTSNIAADIVSGQSKNIGFMEKGAYKNNVEDRIKSELKKFFRPELLNRIDETVIFEKLSKSDILKITARLLSQLKQRVERLGIEITFTKQCEEYIAEKGYDEIYGARPVKREIQRSIEDVLSQLILNGEMQKGESYVCDVKNGKAVVTVK